MAPDFTSFVLDTLWSNWGQGEGTAPPKPAMIDNRNMERKRPRAPTGDFDATIRNGIIVDAVPTTQNEATGFGFNYNYDGGAGVSIEGMSTHEGGHISGIADWKALYGEARRILTADDVRREPIDVTGGGRAWTLRLEDENDESGNWTDYYRYTFKAMFDGRELL